jgi:hypothetical protein
MSRRQRAGAGTEVARSRDVTGGTPRAGALVGPAPERIERS